MELIQEIDQICRVVHSAGTNLQVYGHAIRTILLLACMEVETQWKLILRDNRYQKEQNRLNTKNYVKLLQPFRLDEYIVNLNYYPWLDPVSPFVCWSKEVPTKSLSWYNAYNSTKHDRELNFAEANLRRALDAITACFVMLCAQYGRDFAAEGDRAQRELFELIRAPSWHSSEYYVEGEPLVRKPYFRRRNRSVGL